MYFQRINSSSPEQVFLMVQNATDNTMPVGHAAFYWYTGSQTGGTVAEGRGFQVTFGNTDTNYPPHAGLWAGVVAKRPIVAGDFGSVQCWGWNDFILVMGTTGGDFVTVAATGPAQLTNIVLRPLGIYGNGTNEGAATNAGYMGVVTLSDWSDYGGPYVVPVDGFYTQAGYGTVGTALVTMSDGVVRYCKGHIRAF